MSYASQQAPLTTNKSRQTTHLASLLSQLAQRTQQLEQLSATTAEQASYMRLLGGYHAAWFMASQRIMTPGDAVEEDEGQQVGQQQQQQ
ncbi:hypothetical protein JCM11251_002645 [Rhodosporidiobolus azoricus]